MFSVKMPQRACFIINTESSFWKVEVLHISTESRFWKIDLQILAPKLLEFERLEKLKIKQQLKEIHEKRNQSFDLILVMEDLKLEINRFESQYNATTVGKLYAELDKVNLEIKEWTLRIQLIEKEAIVNTFFKNS